MIFKKKNLNAGIFYKVDPGLDPDHLKKRTLCLRKGGHYRKVHCMSQKINFDKTEGADFKYDNSFSKF